jgi:hypothetical protein
VHTASLHYQSAHLCWRPPPDRMLEDPSVPPGTMPVMPPNPSEFRG